MQDGNIVATSLNAPLAFFRKWDGEKWLGNLVDLVLFSAPKRAQVDGSKKRPKRQVSLPEIRDDLLRFQEILTAEEEADIESCYHELRGRGFLPLDRLAAPSGGSEHNFFPRLG
jgi:hypothetical protein